MITRVEIAGMTCSRCVQAVFTALTPVDGIVRAEAGIGWAVVEHDGRVTVAALRDAIRVAGYEVRDATEERRRLPLV